MQCKACGGANLVPFYHKNNMPLLSNVIYKTKMEAQNAECGKLDLFQCDSCGFVHNYAFRGAPYSEIYENSQMNSSAYKKYCDEIIKILTKKYKIFKAKIIEIGCGNGAFLSALCEKTKSRGFGFDPAFRGNLEKMNLGGGATSKNHPALL